MSNFCKQTFHQQALDEKMYTLWGPTQSEPPQPPDHRNRRIVERDSLYEEPDSFYRNINITATPALASGMAAERQITPWQTPDVGAEGPSNNRAMARPNKIQKTMVEMPFKPIHMANAESMMQKMGWHGGALGRNGRGIVEPIVPNAVYATKKIGFGQSYPIQPPNKTVKLDKDNFTMNVLYTIYEFVKNNSEVELLFDRGLFKEERKRIHCIVQNIVSEDSDMVCFKKDAHMDLVLQICDINCYILHTQSEGNGIDRNLCLYKEAPFHVYLIIPDDLREDAIDPEGADSEAEEETNPFLRSITRNLKKNKDVQPVILSKEEKIAQKILEFFEEFGQDKKYTQLKFLGPFDDEELGCIHSFIDKAARYLDNEPVDAKAVFDKFSFELGEDIAGNTVINKRPK